jgi:hypothetical protein
VPARAAPAAPAIPNGTFAPARRPQLPPATPNGPAHPIDRFLQARLAAEQLGPSPEAEPATLLRRITFDLIGLPPAPEEVTAFVTDHRRDPGQAVESLIDRLLASPRHGERWARHWLDVVHFGETHGYDKDKLRPHAWPYRDYVIRAFNQDTPWGRFVEEQLAGDVLHADHPDGIPALGFLAAGPWDFVGHVELPESKTDGLIARYNDRDDMVMTTFSAFQSLTVHCARCHDHKFDPISQREYYQLQAVFAGVDRANRPYDADPATHRQRRALAAEKKSLEARQKELAETAARLTSPELATLDRRLAAVRAELATLGGTPPGAKSPANGYHSAIEPQPAAAKWVQVDLGRALPLDEVRLVPARPTDFRDTPGFGFPARFKVEAADNPEFANRIVLADQTGKDFPNPGDAPLVLAVPAAKGSPAPLRYLRVTATKLWPRSQDYVFALGELQAFAGGTNAARGAAVTALDSIEAGRWARRHLVDGFSSRGPLSDVAPSPAVLARRQALEADARRLADERARVAQSLLPAGHAAEVERTAARLQQVNAALAALPAPGLVYAAASDFKPEGSFRPANGLRPVHFLARGDVKQPRDLMTPAAPAAVPGPGPGFDLTPGHPESARRAALARWLSDPRNLQTRRSIVNRVWQHHFGRGLVDTPNDFGHLGSAPTHPELLDWLAFWFLDNGESLKKLHRLMLTSAAYRQTSQPAGPAAARAAARDADNRLLWRQNRTRLDAECVRDAMLSVSGQLDLTPGGPSDRQFFFKDDHSPVYDYDRFDVDAREGRRRSIYRHLVRSVTDPFMDCLDAPDPSQIVAKRNATLTALQALATLNNPFVLRQCEHFATRLEREARGLPAQVERACQLAYGRAPTPAERARLADYARRHGLANACRVLLNSTEFMFVD